MKNIIKLYDSRTNKLLLLTEKKIKIYLCGPTLYDDLHIGNLKNIVYFDALVSFLKFQGHEVDYIQNLTDIADKITNIAIKKKTTEKLIADKFYKRYLDLLNLMKIKKPKLIKVTSVIDQIIIFIKKLEIAELTIQKNDGIYFNIEKMKNNYGVFKKIYLDQQIKQNFTKENFVLWKFSNKKKIMKTWNSPWGKGQPGWHTECIVISSFFFKNKTTIHAGGSDLIFPHHENERIQFIGIQNMEPVKIWHHNGFVNFKNEKISKSAPDFFKNFKLLTWLKIYSVNSTKLWFLFGDFLHDLNLNFKQINFCQELEKKITKAFTEINTHAFIQFGTIKNEKINKQDLQIFINFLMNNFATPLALNWIVKKVKELNSIISKKKWSESIDLKNLINEALLILRININIKKPTIADKKLILSWWENLQNKNFMIADKLRKKLIEKKFL